MVQRESSKWILFVFAILIGLPTIGASELNKETYKRLMNVNKNWVGLENEIEHTFTPFSEQELVQLHLLNVISYLEKQSLTKFSKFQKKNRLLNIEILRNYSQVGEFPINSLTTFRTPIFIDSRNTHCAVGFLLKENGLGNVAQEIAENQLLFYLNDIQCAQLTVWQESCGLTLFELALIQPTYGPPTPVCGSPSPTQWNKVPTENARIKQLFEGDNDNFIYGISELNELGLNHEIKKYSSSSKSWTSIGFSIPGQILDLVFSNNQTFISVLLPNEKYPHQILKLNGQKWDKVAHFNGSIQSIQSFENKLYVLGNFNKVNDSISSNIVVIAGKSILPFNPKGLNSRSFDHIKSSKTALFLLNNGWIYQFKNDSIIYLNYIQYYNYFTGLSLDAVEDTLYVSSIGIAGYNKYFDKVEQTFHMNNEIRGQDYPYHSINFTKSRMINGNMIIAGDFKTSTLIPQINDNRVLVHCEDSLSSHWYGEGLIFHQDETFYPILNEGIVIDFVQLNDEIYILKSDGEISYATLGLLNYDPIGIR